MRVVSCVSCAAQGDDRIDVLSLDLLSLAQAKFAKTAAAATAHGLGKRENVYPVISLGACYTRNHSHYPNINGTAFCILRSYNSTPTMYAL